MCRYRSRKYSVYNCGIRGRWISRSQHRENAGDSLYYMHIRRASRRARCPCSFTAIPCIITYAPSLAHTHTKQHITTTFVFTLGTHAVCDVYSHSASQSNPSILHASILTVSIYIFIPPYDLYTQNYLKV